MPTLPETETNLKTPTTWKELENQMPLVLTTAKHAATTIQVDVTPPRWRTVVNQPDHFGMLMSLIAKELKVLSVMADAHSLVLEFDGVMFLKQGLENEELNPLATKDLRPRDLSLISESLRKQVEVLTLQAKPTAPAVDAVAGDY